eukprot:CAMPEP_0185202674 /NCGR_PEP_ID=MMETSP1140-20130426/51505_1 /TAXON_ID=298111 /ORGANISM="Pavlova sp., Strain CCMP459" /LENGTH=427 /DNA_ID=CAMNT_0027770133 /DNA_START=162 /DNA_END=1445 /DNA_ORIENTATION=-
MPPGPVLDFSKASCLAMSVDGELDPTQLSDLLGQAVTSARIRPLDKMGGLSGDFRSVDLVMGNGEASRELVLKRTAPGREGTAISLGTAREGKFFALLAPKLAGLVPHAYHAYGDMATGAKEVLMERIPGSVPCGVFFGRGNPNNWGLTEAALDELVRGAGGLTAMQVAAEAFTAYARLHARFWGDKVLLGHQWLRGASWVQGKGRPEWEAAEMMAADAWADLKTAIEAGTSPIAWDSHVQACLDASFAKVDWSAFQRNFRELPWTLVHGDCHPHNILRARSPTAPHDGAATADSPATSGGRLGIIDFEMVGVGSGAQELGQFLISHMPPAERRAREKELVALYHSTLVGALESAATDPPPEGAHAAYSFERCWAEYVAGGAGRWLWFVPYLAKVCPPEMGQFFHDQLAAFLHDHVPNPTDAPMPRV